MDFSRLDSAQSGARTPARRRATRQLALAWSAQVLIFVALWLADNPQWVWYSLLRESGWSLALASILVLGVPALVGYGSWSIQRERAAIWPAFLLPAVTLVSGALAALFAYGQTMDLGQAPSVRDSGILVHAAAAQNAQRIMCVSFFVTAFLAQFAAPIFLARATADINGVADESANSKGAAITRVVAIVASVLTLIAGFGVGRSTELVVIVFAIIATCALVLATSVVARTAELRCSSLGYIGLCLGLSQVCFAASFLARARTKLFTFFDHPDFSADALASFNRVLERALIVTDWVPWLLLIPLAVVLTGLLTSGSPHLWRWTVLPLAPFVVGAGSLVASEPISDAEVMELSAASQPPFADKVKLPPAFLGKPEVWSERRSIVVVNHAQISLLVRDDEPVVLQAASLLQAPECRTRLARVKTEPGTIVAADASLGTRELDCLLVGSLGLQTSEVETDGASGLDPARAPKLGFVLAAQPPASLARYADALSRYTTVELGVAEQWGPTHLHVSADAWQLIRPGQRQQLKGDVAERSTQLSAALGSDTIVSIDADPSLTIVELLNAALAVKSIAATRSVLKWIPGVSGPPPESDSTTTPPELNGTGAVAATSDPQATAGGSAPRKNGYEDLVKLTTLPFEQGGLPHAVVDQVTRSRLWELGSCYNRLNAKAPVSGSVELRLRIARNGLVDEIPAVGRASKHSAGLMTCARQALLSLRYPEAAKSTPEVVLRIEFGG